MPFQQGPCANFARKHPGTGTWANAMAAAWLMAAPVFAAGPMAWTPMQGPRKIVPDDSWGPAFSRGGTRLDADKEGNLYLTLGDSLHIREAYGGAWRTAPRKGAHFLGDHTPIAVGTNGMVLWGAGSSTDKGRNWASMGMGRIGFPSALAVLPNGNALAGGSYDALDLSVDSGKTWKSVHMGRTFGSIIDIASSVDGWAWAAPQADRLLVSRDYGLTWASADSIIPGAGAKGFYAQYLAPTRTDNAVYAYQRPNSDKGRIVEFNWSDQAGTAKIYPLGQAFPDSAVTALESSRIVFYTKDHGLWVGTWGQGVWLSLDGGTTWASRNEGIKDLHVEALASAPNGDVYVLTRDGLYVQAETSAINFAPGSRPGNGRNVRVGRSARAGAGLFRVGNGSEVSNPIENLFRADGRAARIPSTDQRPAVGAP